MIKMTVSDLYDRAIRLGGDRVALTQDGRSMSYRQLGDGGQRLAGAFSVLGLGRGSRVAFLMANCMEYVACEYAVARIGAVRLPLAVLLANDDHVYMMNFARCEALVYHEKVTARVAAMMPQLETVRYFICVADEPASVPAGHLHLQALWREGTPAAATAAIDAEDLVGIYFTGGTTGRPKGVMLSHRAFVHTYYQEMLDFSIGWRETFVFVTPLTHAAGCLLLPVLLRQGRCVILNHFEPELLLATIERERATATMLVPTMLYILLDHPGRDAYDLQSLRNVLYGAAAIAPERLKQAISRFGARGSVRTDLAQLFRRLLFNVVTGNRDDHLRNHGFLRARDGWRLAPAFDMNPARAAHPHSLSLDGVSGDQSVHTALSTHRLYALSEEDALGVLREVVAAASGWERQAGAVGVPEPERRIVESALTALPEARDLVRA